MVDINGGAARWAKGRSALRPAAIAAYRGFVRATSPRSGPRVFVNSMPKSGTHLAMSLLDAFPGFRFSGRHVAFSEIEALDGPPRGPLPPHAIAGRDALVHELDRVPGRSYMTGHLAYDRDLAAALESSDARLVLFIRDPRAVVVSMARYFRTNPRHNLHATVQRRFPDDEELRTAVIEGFEADDHARRCVPMRQRLELFAPWLEEPGALVLRFEDLVGPRGGGSEAAQADAVARLAAHVGADLDADAVRHVAQRAFDPRSATFREGRIDGWRAHLTTSQLSRLEDECGEAARLLGYDLTASPTAPERSET